MAEPLDKYYEILGLKTSASKADIKRAYRRLALKYHPDKNPGNEKQATTIFTAVNRAYSVLMDKDHIGESFEDIEDVKLYFKKTFRDLARRINSTDEMFEEIHQEECDYFFRYQLEEVQCVKRSSVEAKRVMGLIRKATSKGYDTSGILRDHSDFFRKYGSDGDQKYNNYEELIAEYKSIIEKEPGNADAHYSLGCIYEKRGMIEVALSEYRIASYINSDNANARKAIERLRKRRKGVC